MLQSTQRMYDRMRSEVLREQAYVLLQLMFEGLQIPWVDRVPLPKQIFQILASEADEPTAAYKINQLFGDRSVVIARQLAARARRVAVQVRSRLKGRRVLDFGGGDGQVALSLKDHDVTLYDVDDYRHRRARHLSMLRDLAHAGRYEVALAVAVFHHCDDPAKEIAWLREHADGLVVIESIVDKAIPWAVQALIDWLYNRGMHPGARIPVPGHFHTVEEWKEIFIRRGWIVEYEEDLGIDVPMVPEHHYLYRLT